MPANADVQPGDCWSPRSGRHLPARFSCRQVVNVERDSAYSFARIYGLRTGGRVENFGESWCSTDGNLPPQPADERAGLAEGDGEKGKLGRNRALLQGEAIDANRHSIPAFCCRFAWFIALTLTIAMMLNAVPTAHWPGVPDWLALVLCFWSVREFRRVGMGWAFVLGIPDGRRRWCRPGQHSLAYVLLALPPPALSRRILWFPLAQQALQILPLLLMAQVVQAGIRLAAGADLRMGLLHRPLAATLQMWPPSSSCCPSSSPWNGTTIGRSAGTCKESARG